MRTVPVLLVVFGVLLAGCTSPSTQPPEFNESSTSEDAASDGQPVRLELVTLAENLDKDPQKELRFILYGKDTQGQDTKFSGDLSIILEREVAGGTETILDHSVNVSTSDFVEKFGTRYTRHLDDDLLRSGADYLLTAHVNTGEQTLETTKNVVFFDEAENQPRFDDGEYVEKIDVRAGAENTDADSPKEAVLSVTGFDSGETPHVFAGEANFTVWRNAGGSSSKNWVFEKAGTFPIELDGWPNESYIVSYSFVLDDTVVVDEEQYRIQLNATLAETGRTLRSEVEFTFSDSAENQSGPERRYKDNAEHVERLSVHGSSDNEDEDVDEEIWVSVLGQDQDDKAHRFAATLDILLEREQGSYDDASWVREDEWTVDITPNEFKGSYSPRYEFVIDDDKLESSDGYTEYRVTVTASMNETGESFSDRDEVSYG